VCYCDSWQHHGPAFAAWPAIVFLVSLQSTVRSILPRSSTTTSASFAASYFTGAQHGVARYLGNFAERGCSLCQQPVSRRQRIRRSLRRFHLRFSPLDFSFRFPFAPFSHFLVALSSLQQGSRVRANVHSRVSAFTIVAPPVLLRLSLLSRRTPIRLVLVALRAVFLDSFTRNCFHSAKSFLLCTRFYFAFPRAPDSTRAIRNTGYNGCSNKHDNGDDRATRSLSYRPHAQGVRHKVRPNVATRARLRQRLARGK
jgi:hypothetical protein